LFESTRVVDLMFGLDDDKALLIGLTNDSQTLKNDPQTHKNSRTLKKTQNKNAHMHS
jgi:hypothetical protein